MRVTIHAAEDEIEGNGDIGLVSMLTHSTYGLTGKHQLNTNKAERYEFDYRQNRRMRRTGKTLKYSIYNGL